MMENVTLHGGPEDGRVMVIQGIDTIELARIESLSFKVHPSGPPTFNEERVVYRRSLVTRSIFVWQP